MPCSASPLCLSTQTLRVLVPDFAPFRRRICHWHIRSSSKTSTGFESPYQMKKEVLPNGSRIQGSRKGYAFVGKRRNSEAGDGFFKIKNRNKRNLFRRGGEGGMMSCEASHLCLATVCVVCTQYPPAHLFAKKQSAGLFFLTQKPSQGSNPIQ